MTNGIRVQFSDIKGGSPDTALTKHFLGATIDLSVNAPGSAALDFILPSDANGILTNSGLPPLAVSIQNADGVTLFRGKASGTFKNPSPKARSVRVLYHDPMYWELSDIAPFTYPTGTLAEICDALTRGKKVTFQVDPQITHTFPAGGGTPIACFDLIVQLVGEAGAYVVYDPAVESVRVKRWTPARPVSLSTDQLVHAQHITVDASFALTSLKVYGRKGLKNDWDETEMKPRDASLELGEMGVEADAWVREALMTRTRTTIAHNRVPSAAKQLASDLLSATIIRAVRSTFTVRNVSVLCGDTVSLPATGMCDAGEFLVEKIRYDYRSANLLAEIQGVRA